MPSDLELVRAQTPAERVQFVLDGQYASLYHQLSHRSRMTFGWDASAPPWRQTSPARVGAKPDGHRRLTRSNPAAQGKAAFARWSATRSETLPVGAELRGRAASEPAILPKTVPTVNPIPAKYPL